MAMKKLCNLTTKCTVHTNILQSVISWKWNGKFCGVFTLLFILI